MGTNKTSHKKERYDETKIYAKAYDLANNGRNQEVPVYIIRSTDGRSDKPSTLSTS